MILKWFLRHTYVTSFVILMSLEKALEWILKKRKWGFHCPSVSCTANKMHDSSFVRHCWTDPDFWHDGILIECPPQTFLRAESPRSWNWPSRHTWHDVCRDVRVMSYAQSLVPTHCRHKVTLVTQCYLLLPQHTCPWSKDTRGQPTLQRSAFYLSMDSSIRLVHRVLNKVILFYFNYVESSRSSRWRQLLMIIIVMEKKDRILANNWHAYCRAV
jgi:hypothetical protein